MSQNNNGEKPAFATPMTFDKQGRGANGLTKREYMATQIMVGILAGRNGPIHKTWLANEAASESVHRADALLEALAQNEVSKNE